MVFRIVTLLDTQGYQVKHSLVQGIDPPFQQVDFIGAAVDPNGLSYGGFHQHEVGRFILYIESVQCSHDGSLESLLVHRDGFGTVFLAVIQATDTSPHDSPLSTDVPCDSLIPAAAFTADHDFREGVLGILARGCHG